VSSFYLPIKSYGLRDQNVGAQRSAPLKVFILKWMPILFFCLTGLPATLQADLYQELEAVLDRKMTETAVPGILMGVWRGETEVAVFEKGFSNVQTSEPIHRLQSMRMASVTKSFTVTRILQLHDAGLLSMDDPIGHYVPGLQNGHATLRQLANMTSGIFNYTEDSGLVTELITNPTRVWTDTELVQVANAPVHSPYFTPGNGWHYSNTNTVLLGMVIEAVTGNFYANEIAQSISQPLGLMKTIYPNGDLPPAPFSEGYANFGDGIVNFSEASPTAASASGSLVSTLDDLRIWATALAQGTLLSPETQEERLMMIPLGEEAHPEYDSYGLGIGSLDGWLGHTGDFPGYQSLIMHALLSDHTVVI
jgi:D-alanyl-D-alanine carboxypeptidase